MAAPGNKNAAHMGDGGSVPKRIKTNSKNEARFGSKPVRVTYERPEQMIPPGEPITAESLAKARIEYRRRNQATEPRLTKRQPGKSI